MSLDQLTAARDRLDTLNSSQIPTSSRPSRYVNSGWTSAPLPAGDIPGYPSFLKETSVHAKQGVSTAYLTGYNNDDATPFVDPSGDIISPGSFSQAIKDLSTNRNRGHTAWLCPSLWPHDRHERIGDAKSLPEDAQGVMYEAQGSMGVQRARETLDLAQNRMIGSCSSGYDPLGWEILPGHIRKRNAIGLRETSCLTLPANELANIIDVKQWYSNQKRNLNAHRSDEQREEMLGKLLDQREDLLWRVQRREAYEANHAAFLERSRFGRG